VKLIRTVAILLVVGLCITGFAGEHRPRGADDILGTWLTGDKEARVTIFKAGNTYYGKISWLEEPFTESGNFKTDVKNSNKALQSKPLENLLILKRFEYSAVDEVWQYGTLYDPKSGKTFNCKMELSNAATLQVRALVGIALTGKTDTWTKVE
jgi:uncharacterized protein (DUF2147 family)